MNLDQETIKRIEERAALLGLTPEQYLSIAEENFWQDEQFLTCAKCGHRILIDEAGLSPAHQGDTCPSCGAPDEEAFGGG